MGQDAVERLSCAIVEEIDQFNSQVIVSGENTTFSSISLRPREVHNNS
jgi:hypothetical protein